MLIKTWLTLSQCGLVIDIIGAALIFFFALPSKIDRDEGDVLLINGPSKEDEAAKKEKNEVIRCWAHIGLGLLVLGFTLQFIGSLR